MTNVMLDLETFGTAPGCAILAIGAVQFDPRAGDLGVTFYTDVDPVDCQRLGLTVDASTVLWWLAQGDVARATITRQPRQPLATALACFARWFPPGATRLWCHGATFDVPVLDAAYRAAGLPTPWSYRDVRDTRTLFELTDVTLQRSVTEPAHHALDDAVSQALVVQEAYQKLKIT